jgi:hypothetical protein
MLLNLCQSHELSLRTIKGLMIRKAETPIKCTHLQVFPAINHIHFRNEIANFSGAGKAPAVLNKSHLRTVTHAGHN